MDVAGAHCEGSWKLLEFKPNFCTHTDNNVSLKLCKGNVENKMWGCLQFKDFGLVVFFLPLEVCWQCEKFD